MNYYDSRWRNNEINHLDSCLSFLKPLLEAFKFACGFSTGISLNILIIYGKDPNFKKIMFCIDLESRSYDTNHKPECHLYNQVINNNFWKYIVIHRQILLE